MRPLFRLIFVRSSPRQFKYAQRAARRVQAKLRAKLISCGPLLKTYIALAKSHYSSRTVTTCSLSSHACSQPSSDCCSCCRIRGVRQHHCFTTASKRTAVTSCRRKQRSARNLHSPGGGNQLRNVSSMPRSTHGESVPSAGAGRARNVSTF